MLRRGGARRGPDLTKDARPSYGAPPLIAEKFAQGETDTALEFWNFCRRSRRARLPPRDRNGRCREGARRDRPGGDDRLRVQRKLRRLAQGRAQALLRRDERGAQDLARRSGRLGADQGAAAPEGRRGARSLPPALSRRRAEADHRRGGRGREHPLPPAGCGRRARAGRRRPRRSTPASSTIPRRANSAWRRVSSRSSRSLVCGRSPRISAIRGCCQAR